MQLFSHDKHGSRALAPNDNVAQHGSLTRGNTMSCSLGFQRISLILDIYVMVNWHLSKQGIRWPATLDYIAGSGWELIELLCFLKLTADQVLIFDWIVGSCLVNFVVIRGLFLESTGNFSARKVIAKSWALLVQSCFIHILLIWTEVHFIQVSGPHTSLFLDTDELKMALQARKVSGPFENWAPGPGCL